jgi:hypothetical protein
MLAGSLLSNAQSLIDLYWVGRLGSPAVAALALSGTTLMLLFPLVIGTATGTIALVSRRIGAREPDRAADTAGQSLGLAVMLGVVSGGIGWCFTEQIARLMGAAPAVLPLEILSGPKSRRRCRAVRTTRRLPAMPYHSKGGAGPLRKNGTCVSMNHPASTEVPPLKITIPGSQAMNQLSPLMCSFSEALARTTTSPSLCLFPS